MVHSQYPKRLSHQPSLVPVSASTTGFADLTKLANADPPNIYLEGLNIRDLHKDDHFTVFLSLVRYVFVELRMSWNWQQISRNPDPPQTCVDCSSAKTPDGPQSFRLKATSA